MIQQIDPKKYHALARGPDLRDWAVSKSLLSDFAACPWDWKRRHDAKEQKKPSDAMDWGSAMDWMLTTGEHETPIVYVDSATWLGKAAQAERESIRASGKIPLLARQQWDLEDASKNMMSHLAKHGVFQGLQTQAMVVFSQEIDGEPLVFKALADFWQPDIPRLSDLKTTNSLDEWDLRRTCKKWKYHWQAALYIDGFRAHGFDLPEEFDLHFSESVAPFRTRKLTLTPEDIARGREEYLAAARLWKTCLSLKPGAEWPGKQLPEMRGIFL